MEINFKSDEEKKVFRDNVVDSLSALDYSSPQFTQSRDFLKGLYDLSK